MALRIALRHVPRASAAAVPAVSRPLAVQARAIGTFDDKERAEEAIFIRKEEERLLKNMMAKMRERNQKGRKELEEILGSHSLPEDIIQKLLDWKYHN